MNNITKKFKNEEGIEETMIISSTDDLKVSLNGRYQLANKMKNSNNKLTDKFKNSILGSDIGIRSKGFGSVAILSTIIAVLVLVAMYFMWRF